LKVSKASLSEAPTFNYVSKVQNTLGVLAGGLLKAVGIPIANGISISLLWSVMRAERLTEEQVLGGKV
jgi:hypothetical protein